MPAVPPAGAPPRPRGLGYGAFLARAVTVAALVPLTAVGVLMALLLPVVLIGLVVGEGEGGPTDTKVGPTRHLAGTDGAADVVLVVRVRGPILADQGGGWLFGGEATGGYAVKKVLERAAADRKIDAVVLELSTPGGSVVGSEAIADGVALVKKAGKPVIAHVTELSASGGVWAMVAADRVLADEGSIVGSIGVLLGPFRQYTEATAIDDGAFLGGVETAGGATEFYITAGTGKDAGNPFRPLTDDERARFQALVDAAYGRFVDHVAANRPQLGPERIREELGASVFDARRAVDLGLVDAIATREEAYEEAARAAGLDRFDVRTPVVSTGFLAGLLGADDRRPAPVADLSGLCGSSPRVVLFYGNLAATCAAAASR